METIADRIIYVLKEKESGNKKKFADKVKIAPSYISMIDKDRTMVPSARILDKIASSYHANRDWLETGSGDPFIPVPLGEAMGEIAATAATHNVDAVRKFFRELGDEFSDAEILFLYEIYKKHFGQNIENKD